MLLLLKIIMFLKGRKYEIIFEGKLSYFSKYLISLADYSIN